jgi:uncharacterized protein (UPF0335 family)
LINIFKIIMADLTEFIEQVERLEAFNIHKPDQLYEINYDTTTDSSSVNQSLKHGLTSGNKTYSRHKQ